MYPQAKVCAIGATLWPQPQQAGLKTQVCKSKRQGTALSTDSSLTQVMLEIIACQKSDRQVYPNLTYLVFLQLIEKEHGIIGKVE